MKNRLLYAIFTVMVSFLLASFPTLAQQTTVGYRSYVVKKNGERIYGSVKILDSPLGFGTTIMVNDSIKLTFHYFDSLMIRYQQFILHQEVIHRRGRITFKYNFLKKLNGGPIPIYARISDQSELLSKKTYDYFMLQDSSIGKVSYPNLSGILLQNPESAAILKKYRKFRRWSNITLVAGGATLIYGLLRSDFKRGFEPFSKQSQIQTIFVDFNNAVFVGLGFIVTTTIFRGISKGYLKKSIDMYNRK